MDLGTSGTADSFETGVAALLDGLGRLVKIAPLYAADHARSLSASGEVLGWIQTLGGSSGLTLGVGDAGLAVTARGRPVVHGECDSLRAVLLSLGVGRVDFDPLVQSQDLHALVNRLLALQRGLGSAAGKVELDGFPGTIEVSAREFGARVAVSREAGYARRAVEGLFQAVESAEVDEAHKEAARRFCELLQRGLAEHFERQASLKGKVAKAAPNATAFLERGIAAVQAALRKRLADGALATPEGLERLAEEAASESGDKLLGELLSQAAQAAQEEPIGGASEDAAAPDARPDARPKEIKGTGHELHCFADNKLSLKVLEQLRDRCAQETSFPPPELYDMGEWIAVLFDVLNRTPVERFPGAFFHHLDTALRLPLEEPAREALRGALFQLLRTGELARVDGLFPILAEALRSSRSYPVAMLLEDLLAEPKAVLSMLWPHLANEYLLGFRAGNLERERALLLHVKALPQQEWANGVARLRKLSSVRTKELSKKVFANPGPQLFPLLAALLEGPHVRELGNRVLANLRISPLSWPGAEALSVLHGYDSTSAEFLRWIFREDARRDASPELQVHAARILTDALSALSEDKLDQPWIPIAIASLGKIGYQPAVPVLRNIERGRRHMFLRAWPKALRTAARLSLDKLAAAERKSA